MYTFVLWKSKSDGSIFQGVVVVDGHFVQAYPVSVALGLISGVGMGSLG